MTEMPKPLLPWMACEGRPYWASKGNTKWSAVRIIKCSRVWAQVERVIPRTEKIIHRKGKVRLDELVQRDPKLKGKDKPKAPPSEVFKRVRELREEKPPVVAPAPEVKPEVAPEPTKAEPGRKLEDGWGREIFIKIFMARGVSRKEAERQHDEEASDDW